MPDLIQEANALLRELVDTDPYYQHEYGDTKCMFCQASLRDGHDSDCLVILTEAFLNKQEN